MNLEQLGRRRQLKGYSMDMMAEFLRISLESYAELEFQVREATQREREILRRLLVNR